MDTRSETHPPTLTVEERIAAFNALDLARCSPHELAYDAFAKVTLCAVRSTAREDVSEYYELQFLRIINLTLRFRGPSYFLVKRHQAFADSLFLRQSLEKNKVYIPLGDQPLHFSLTLNKGSIDIAAAEARLVPVNRVPCGGRFIVPFGRKRM